ncbi:hypothetical protein INT43_004042 [Umbelopsis isabellina]|uniref:Uncharacterized protein n=1 Tax=Mortierella isabellina TaxID=91625 RepID=A0A8H7PUS5_MORIS|nr:hypothetical protein INT43_004042 [Umbelopsis isabellina]
MEPTSNTLRQPASPMVLMIPAMGESDAESGFDIAVIESTMILWAIDPRKQKPVKRALTDDRQILSLVRYNSDLQEFDEKIREHFRKTKVVLPPLDTPSDKQHNLKRRSFRNLLTALPSLKSKQSNSEKVEQYLRRCAEDNVVGKSSLFRDFFTPQRDEDCSTAKERMQNYMNMHAAAWVNEQQQQERSKQKQKQKAPIHGNEQRNDIIPPSPRRSDSSTRIEPSNSKLRALAQPQKSEVFNVADPSTELVFSSSSGGEMEPPSRSTTPKRKMTIQDFQILKVLGKGCMGKVAKWYKLPPSRCRLYTAEILLGIQELHRLGILYRDLKPENILLGADGHIILTDFGLSKQFLPQTGINNQRTTTFCGTAEYLAPEILRGDEYSFAVDFWSLGTLLYEMITGIPPFWAENHADMYNRVLDDELEFPPNFDTVTADFISGLLHRVPQDRLGAGPYGPQEIRSHPYFSGLDWADVYHKRIKPDYIPTFQSETDLSNFDETFVAMPARFSMASQGEGLSQSIQGDFDGYSYCGASLQGGDSRIEDFNAYQNHDRLYHSFQPNQTLESFYPTYGDKFQRESPIDPLAVNGHITSGPTPERSPEPEYTNDINQEWNRKRSTTDLSSVTGRETVHTSRYPSDATVEEDERHWAKRRTLPEEAHRASPYSMARDEHHRKMSYASSTASYTEYREIRSMLKQHQDIIDANMSLESLSIDDNSFRSHTPVGTNSDRRNSRQGSTTPQTPTLRRAKDFFSRN